MSQDDPMPTELAGQAADVTNPGGARDGAAPLPIDGRAFEELIATVAELGRSIAEANRLGEERERIVDRLHEENQRLKAGELALLVIPIWRDLFRLHDDLDRTAVAWAAKGEPAMKAATREFECFRDAVLDLLCRHGVEPFGAIAGMPFEAKEQRAVVIVPTADEAQDRTVARVSKVGFRSETRILRTVDVDVYRVSTVPLPKAATEEFKKGDE